MKILHLMAALSLGLGSLAAADAPTVESNGSKPVAKTKDGKEAKKPTSLALQLMAIEEQWEFVPPPMRVDPFYDREKIIAVDLAISTRPIEGAGGEAQSGQPKPSDQRAELLAMAASESQRIESLIANRKYEEAVRTCEAAIKRLERFAEDAEIAKAMARIKVFNDQASEAIIRIEAQGAFDKLGLKIEGIMWAEAGNRLAIVAGEPRAAGVNDRTKDCVIINIDSDRVDFRFHYKGRRFEFPRYVGEDGSGRTAQ